MLENVQETMVEEVVNNSGDFMEEAAKEVASSTNVWEIIGKGGVVVGTVAAVGYGTYRLVKHFKNRTKINADDTVDGEYKEVETEETDITEDANFKKLAETFKESKKKK